MRNHVLTFFIVFVCILISIVGTPTYCQSTNLQIDDGKPINEIVKSLEGPRVDIFNITSSILAELNNSTAFFNDVLGLMDIDKGLLMTTGLAKNAQGPNNAADTGFSGFGTESEDLDLSTLIDGDSLYDIVTVEFDIIGVFDELSFSYVFGSEEYPEFVNQGFNDVFGFFISGPGISGRENIAIVGDNDPVSINSINENVNSDLYIANGIGQNPALDFYLQYDGYTKKLKAKATIIPCETYHIKLAIADFGDDTYDSGVFIEQESFTSTNSYSININYEHNIYKYAIEGCNKGFFTINRSPNVDASQKLELPYTLSGVAGNGVDYHQITSNTITIPSGELFTTIEIDPLPDELMEGVETIILEVVTSQCDITTSVVKAEMPLRDIFDYVIPETKGCANIELTLNENPDDRYSFIWEDDPLLSCTKCPSPVISLIDVDTFYVSVQDDIIGCSTISSAIATANLVDAFFKYQSNDNYTTLDAFFNNQTIGENRYEWEFGDDKQSTEFEPSHTYVLDGFFDQIEYTIKLTAFSESPICMDMYDTTIVIQEPFFIPNVITPNNDGKNDAFVIKGIKRGVWNLSILNRWGKLVYQNSNYDQSWESTGLSSGVYFYELINPNGDRVFTGWVHTLKP